MPTLNEYASLSTHVYNDQRGGGPQAETNKLNLPPGWQPLNRLGFNVGLYLNINPFSFTAEAYVNGSGDIVIAYKGTDFLTQFEGRSWNTVMDLLADAGMATTLANLNLPQQLYAASYYAAVKDWAVSNGHDPAKISFTGHSLGGGLASNMAVWFDKKATVFAEGPFEIGTLNRLVMTATIAALTLQATASGSLAVLEEINRLREMLPPEFLTQEFARREPNVTNYANEGEFLGYFRAILPTVVGNNQDFVIPLGFQPIVERAVVLHSMNLHAAFLFDDRFRQQAVDMPELIPALLDKTLYAADPNFATEDLVTRLVDDQLRQGFDNDSALKRFSADLQTIRLPGGAAGRASMQTALIAAAMDYYALKSPGEASSLLSVQAGAVHFDYRDIGGQYYKSLPRLRVALSELLSSPSEVSQLNRRIDAADSWHIQKGGGSMNWTAENLANDGAVGGAQSDELHGGDGDDLLIGQDSIDTLAGDTGSDTLLGGAGADWLSGGAGSDYLMGGADVDTYVVDNAGDAVLELGVFKGGFDASNDTVETPFETNLASTYANVENVTLVGTAGVGATGNAVANRLDGSLNSAVNRLAGGLGNDTYAVGAGDIVIEGVEEGIDTLVVAAAAATTVRLSDYPNVENLRLAAASGALDAEGSAAANVLQGSLGNNRLSGGDGNDTLSDQSLADITMYGGRVAVGDRDTLDGGAGDDLLTGYGGDDTFDGGAGDDRIVVNGQTGANGSTTASAVTVRFGLGDGHDTVQRIAAPLNRYAIELDPGSDLSNVQLRTSADAFIIELSDGSSLSFASAVNPGSPPTLAVDLNLSLSFADGLTLDRQTLQTLLASPLSSTPTAGADLLLGSAGADVIDALGGDDMVLAGAGDDRVDGGAGADRLSGDAGRDSLFGNAGADTLVGGAGDDLLAGGAGPDTYRFARGFGHDFVADDLVAAQVVGPDDRSVDSVEFEVGILPTDIAIYHRVEGRDITGLVLELTATGDSVELHHSHQVFQPGQVENVRFADGTVWDLTAMNARLAGALGTDADDVLGEPGNSSVLRGYGGNDVLSAYGGNDILDGGLGNDVMSGDLGDDTYFVDSPGDVVIEMSATGGNDTVASSIDYTLGSYVERLQLAGTAALRGTGNALANTLIGNAGANRLDGLGGADAMAGGAGDDVFVVESTGDAVSEAAGEGIDSVESTVTFTLGANVENLTLFGSAKINGTGNDLGNMLVGNSAVNVLNGFGGNDRLDGGGGADSMTGGADNDTYVVDTASDKTIEVSGGGIDTVETHLAWTLAAEVERLVLTAGSAVSGTGNALANQLFGSEAANVLDGKAGVDVLLGGGGNDTLQDTNGTSPSGNSAFDGGTGNDVLKGTTAADLLAGGRGDDTLTMGGGTDVICFNRGDGLDTLTAPASGAGSGERNDTISLGGVGIVQMQLSRDASDLLVKVAGTTDALRIKSWYLGIANQTISRLQVVVDTTPDFAPGTGDVLRSSRLCVLDFVSLVNAFDAARAANPTLVNWTPTDAQFAAARLGSSDSVAIGGTLAYRYAADGTLGQVGYSTAVADLLSAGFGSAAQTVSPAAPAGAQRALQTQGDESAAALSFGTASVSTELGSAGFAAPVQFVGAALVPITADDDRRVSEAIDGSPISAPRATQEEAGAQPSLLDAIEMAGVAPGPDSSSGTAESIVSHDANRVAAAPEAAPPVPSMMLGVAATGATTILDPVRQASARVGTPSADLALTRVDQATRHDLIQAFGEVADEGLPSSISESFAAPQGADEGLSTAQRLAVSSDGWSEARTVRESDPIDLGIESQTELDRRIQQVADAWFVPRPPSTDIALSHFDEITLGVLDSSSDDVNGTPPSERSKSYAHDWQKMRARVSAFEAVGTDAGWGWDVGLAALARGSDPAGASFNPSVTLPSALRSKDASLPLFAGLQDGFERL